MQITVKDLAARIGGEVEGDGTLMLTGIAPIPRAQMSEATFAETERHWPAAAASAAGAVIVPANAPASSKALIRVKNPRAAFARALQLFHPPKQYPAKIHPTAQIGANVRLGEGVFVGEHAVLRDGAAFGDRSVVEANCVIGENVSIGEDCRVYPGVVIYPGVRIGHRVIVHAGAVLGSDGFGYAQDGAQKIKIPHLGDVVIEDDVEIGANVTIDRAMMGSTVIKRGTKIDNLVQIAHNVSVGEDCVIISQVGIAGSVQIGDNVTLAGQAGIADHVKIGANTRIGAQAGVTQDVPEGVDMWGTPAQIKTQFMRQIVALRKLPELLRKRGLKPE